MHVVQIGFLVDPQARPPARLLDDWFALRDLALATASAGTRVSVIQASTVPGTVQRGDVSFHFPAPERPGALLADSAVFRALLGELAPDLIHVHGLGFPAEVLSLHALAPAVPILLQDHVDRLPRPWRRRAFRRMAAVTAGLVFPAREHAEPFLRARLLGQSSRIFEIAESTSTFTPGDQALARRMSGLSGSPALLWVGHLNRNKDPLTVLDGIASVTGEFPELRLWCCFGRAPLLGAVKRRIAADSRLRNRVHLLGRRSHSEVELLMRAADLFVLGSHREGSNFSVIECLATGLLPVVTDIASTRVLTANGRVGRLWTSGDSLSLAQALRDAARLPRDHTRHAILQHFDGWLSASAIGRRFTEAYAAMLAANVGSGATAIAPATEHGA